MLAPWNTESSNCRDHRDTSHQHQAPSLMRFYMPRVSCIHTYTYTYANAYIYIYKTISQLFVQLQSSPRRQDRTTRIFHAATSCLFLVSSVPCHVVASTHRQNFCCVTTCHGILRNSTRQRIETRNLLDNNSLVRSIRCEYLCAVEIESQLITPLRIQSWGRLASASSAISTISRMTTARGWNSIPAAKVIFLSRVIPAQIL